jgi:type IV secretory pathway protease TraF
MFSNKKQVPISNINIFHPLNTKLQAYMCALVPLLKRLCALLHRTVCIIDNDSLSHTVIIIIVVI